MHLLHVRGAIVTYSDTRIPRLRTDGLELAAIDLENGLSGCDCAVIVTDHTGIDYAAVAARVPLVVDTRNALRGVESENIVRL